VRNTIHATIDSENTMRAAITPPMPQTYPTIFNVTASIDVTSFGDGQGTGVEVTHELESQNLAGGT